MKNSYNLIRQSIKKWGKNLNRHLKVINKYMKRYSTLLVTKEIKVKATRGYHYILT